MCESFETYAGHSAAVHVLPVYGGQGYGTQLSALRRGVHIVVGTPGRIMDLLDKRTLDLSALKYLVLDEADEMLKMGFAEDVETILSQTPREQAGGDVLRHHARRPSGASAPSTCATPSRSPSARRPPRRPTSPSATSW